MPCGWWLGGLLVANLASAQPVSAPVAPRPGPAPGPVVLQADRIEGRPDRDAVAEGAVELQRDNLKIRADRLEYRYADDTARAVGNVHVTRDGNEFSGPEVQIQLERYEGFFLQPEYFFAATQAHGRADRLDFLDADRSQLRNATYSSCDRNGAGSPDWLMQADHVSFDFESNEGIAEGAVLRFLGVPILGAPVVSFPLSDARKSGWLPPDINIDNKSGLGIAMPYYWNIAPNRDATLTPTLASNRGPGLNTEFRYLEPRHRGEVELDLVPNDRSEGRSRHAAGLVSEGRLPWQVDYQVAVLRVSDDNYWKDFSLPSSQLTQRLLPAQVRFERPFRVAGGNGLAYAGALGWQVLQADDGPIDPPYARLPQVGVSFEGVLPHGFEVSLQTEVNRFVKSDDGIFTLPPADNPGLYGGDGTRWHALGSVAWTWQRPGWWVTPKLLLNLASYHTDDPMESGDRSASRAIPTFSVGAGMWFERGTAWSGRSLRQTLEPRLLYVNTPRQDQKGLPNFDAAVKDLNEVSIFDENIFSGVDRVADAHQVTAGVTSRLLDAETGNEQARFALAQRYLFRDQLVRPADGPALTQRFSEVLLLGSSRVGSKWTLDASVIYAPEIERITRSIVGARFSPGPFRTINTRYRLARDSSEQIELGWQWPLSSAAPPAARPAGNGACKGTLYSVGRLNYSLRDSRMTDSLVGLEYDAGCWIARVVGESLSTGRAEATTRLMLQLELVGLSRLGSNPLQVLKDNIEGYRLLRDDRPMPPAPTSYE